MSDSKRNKKYSNKKETKRPIILTKRDGGKDEKASRKGQQTEEKIQPKILIKVKEKEPVPPPISIATRETIETTEQSPNAVTIQSKEKEPVISVTSIEQPIQPVTRMTRPVTLISGSNYQASPNTMKLFIKSNTDFFVVSVIGCQGVGKSTIMNLLASENSQKNPYKYFFKDKEGIFWVKNKTGKSTSYPNTESVQMFITNDRMILLDCPPVLCNPLRKDATENELDDIEMLMLLLVACHLIIVVQDDSFDLSLLRLLQFAELANQNNKSIVNDHLPNILFVKNNAKRNDFLPDEKQKVELILKHIFKHSQLKIFTGSDKNKKGGKQIDHDKCVNYLPFPEIVGDKLTAYHPNLDMLTINLRNRVHMSLYNGNSELTEAQWFELIASMPSKKKNFFLSTYEEIRKSHTRSNVDQGIKD